MQNPNYPALALVPPDHSEAPAEGPRRQTEEQVLGNLNPQQYHHLVMARGTDEVVRLVPIPMSSPGVLERLTSLLDTAAQARAAAEVLGEPMVTEAGRALHPGEAWAAAENAAQFSLRAYQTELANTWPVAAWSDTLGGIARVAAAAQAWPLLGVVARGLEHAPGSTAWWEAVLHVNGLWAGRHFQSA